MNIIVILHQTAVPTLHLVHEAAELLLVDTQNCEQVKVTHAVGRQKSECLFSADFFDEAEYVEVDFVCALQLRTVALLPK